MISGSVVFSMPRSWGRSVRCEGRDVAGISSGCVDNSTTVVKVPTLRAKVLKGTCITGVVSDVCNACVDLSENCIDNFVGGFVCDVIAESVDLIGDFVDVVSGDFVDDFVSGFVCEVISKYVDVVGDFVDVVSVDFVDDFVSGFVSNVTNELVDESFANVDRVGKVVNIDHDLVEGVITFVGGRTVMPNGRLSKTYIFFLIFTV